MGHDSRAGVKDENYRDEDDQDVVWCFPERKTVQHGTEKSMPRCIGNLGCDEKRQTEVAWTSGTKGR